MSMKLNRQEYEELVKEDLTWLDKQEDNALSDHIRAVVKDSVRWYYDAMTTPFSIRERPARVAPQRPRKDSQPRFVAKRFRQRGPPLTLPRLALLVGSKLGGNKGGSTMTVQQFIEEVRALRLEWRNPTLFGRTTAIRCNLGDCPVLALARSKGLVKSHWSNASYELAGEALGLQHQDIQLIVLQADSGNPFFYQELTREG